MIYTDKFVYVHQPKTGGTFVTTVLLRLYDMKWTWLTHLKSTLIRNIHHQGKYGLLIYNNHKHGGCNSIPPEQQGKPILATVRNPYDLYVSQYEFGWWKRREFRHYFRTVSNFERDYPNFPNISFSEYMRLSHVAFGSFSRWEDEDSLGLQSQEFIKFYFRNPGQVAEKMSEDYIASGDYRREMFELHFIRTEQLNRELYDFLLERGYEDKDIDFILSAGKILPQGRGRSREQKWERYYTPELKELVRRKDRVLFNLFPEYDA